MVDDWTDRRDSSIERVRIMEDQAWAVESARMKTKAIEKANREHNLYGALQEMGLTLPSRDAADGEEIAQTPEDEFVRRVYTLRSSLKYSQILPSKFIEEWIEKLEDLRVFSMETGRTLTQFRKAYESTMQQHRPDNFSINEGMRFLDETSEVERELIWLERFLSERSKRLLRLAFEDCFSLDIEHVGKPKRSATQRAAREEIKAMARSGGPEGLLCCPICRASVKGKSLVMHFDKNHA